MPSKNSLLHIRLYCVFSWCELREGFPTCMVSPSRTWSAHYRPQQTEVKPWAIKLVGRLSLRIRGHAPLCTALSCTEHNLVPWCQATTMYLMPSTLLSDGSSCSSLSMINSPIAAEVIGSSHRIYSRSFCDMGDLKVYPIFVQQL